MATIVRYGVGLVSDSGSRRYEHLVTRNMKQKRAGTSPARKGRLDDHCEYVVELLAGYLHGTMYGAHVLYVAG